MKKSVMIMLTAVLVLLCGCQTGEDADTSDYKDDMAKAQEITVVSADTSEVLETMTAKEDIEDFVQTLRLDEWESKELPEGADPVGEFVFSQEETVKNGQTETDGRLYDMAAVTLYEDSYIQFEISGLDMTFKVSQKTADDLNRYFK